MRVDVDIDSACFRSFFGFLSFSFLVFCGFCIFMLIFLFFFFFGLLPFGCLIDYRFFFSSAFALLLYRLLFLLPFSSAHSARFPPFPASLPFLPRLLPLPTSNLPLQKLAPPLRPTRRRRPNRSPTSRPEPRQCQRPRPTRSPRHAFSCRRGAPPGF